MGTNIDLLYNCRKDFCIVALTGLSGSGCSGIAKMICEGNFLTNAKYDIRKPDDIIVDKPIHLTNTDIFDSHSTEQTYAAIKKMVFKRKYTICYDYVSANYNPFTLIKYNKVLWLYTLKYIVNNFGDRASVELLREKVLTLIQEIYHPSYQKNCTVEYDAISHSRYKCKLEDIEKLVNWQTLLETILKLPQLEEQVYNDADYKELYKIFFDKKSPLTEFYLNFNQVFSEKDYYCYCFFYHRLGVAIRSVGSPLENFSDTSNFEKFAARNEQIFSVVKIINTLGVFY